METENKKILKEGAASFGIHLGEKDIEAFDLFLLELLRWNRKINLTAIRTERGVILKHFLDSLSAYPYLPPASTLLDIGSGAGFPGIPLKIVKPSLEITLVDSVRKKVDFQRHIIRKLGLKGIEAIHGRIQERTILKGLEGRFRIITSRAFSDLRNLLVLSVPFLEKRGWVIAMKGIVDDQEIRSLTETEGSRYRLHKTISLVLPFSAFKRTILLFERE
jgi:16S rRNA (guanine527-N7)-methyltransferase